MKKCKSDSITLINNKGIDKPNEDYYICYDTKGVYILLDGVTRDRENGIYPNPSPSFFVSKIFSEFVYTMLVENLDKSDNILYLLNSAIKFGNEKIETYNNKKIWDDDFLPGTVGIVSVIKNDKLYFAYIGDCYGIIVNTQKRFFTKCQTDKIVKHKKEFSAYEIRNKICNNKSHPYSYGVFNGDKKALDFVEYGVIDINIDDKIVLCSDGFADVVNKLSGSEIYTMSLEHMLDFSKESDDKTMIIIEVDSYDKENI